LTNDTTRLFGLEGVEVVSVEIDEDDNPMLALITAADQARYCPGCAVRSEYPHSWVRTRPRDLPIAGRPSELTWNKRRCDAVTRAARGPRSPRPSRRSHRARA
jgi:transposase